MPAYMHGAMVAQTALTLVSSGYNAAYFLGYCLRPQNCGIGQAARRGRRVATATLVLVNLAFLAHSLARVVALWQPLDGIGPGGELLVGSLLTLASLTITILILRAGGSR